MVKGLRVSIHRTANKIKMRGDGWTRGGKNKPELNLYLLILRGPGWFTKGCRLAGNRKEGEEVGRSQLTLGSRAMPVQRDD